MSDVWYLGIGGQQQGPLGTQQIFDMIRAGVVTVTAYVYGGGVANWTPITQVPTFAPALHAAPPPPPPPPLQAAPVAADQIDFEIFGAEMQFVEITLDPGEAAIAEAGSFFYMDPGIRMETIFGDGSAQAQNQGFMGKLLGGAKRVLTGESLFTTVFGNGAPTRQKVSFAAPYPGKIIPVDLRQHQGTLLCQKTRSCAPPRASPSASPGTRSSAPAAPWCRAIWRRGRPCASTPDVWWPSSRV